MRVSKALLQALQRLVAGECVPASSLRGDVADRLLEEGYLTVRANGSRRSFKALDPDAMRSFLAYLSEELRDIESFAACMDNDGLSRAEQAAGTGNSKLMTVRSCPGFPVNSYEPIDCGLNGSGFVVNPPDGSFVFVADWKSFVVPPDVIVVGIENMENFRMVRRQQAFFEDYFKAKAGRLLFVSRYPQSTDLRTWLQSIPNRYVHFGDFDLAGINIFLTEFHRYLSFRSSFLIPDDIASRIANGSSERYNAQYARFHSLTTEIPELRSLIGLINSHRRCYDQEGYILG